MSTENYQLHGRTAVVYIDNPPVNGIGFAVRQELAAHLERALADPQVQAIVIAGAGALFCGGADIKAFNTPLSRAEPSSRTLIARIEAAPKPVIAAIHGNALGLGLELAMGCHYRVARRGAKLGLPEVKLGLVPGAGGTQRLPRLVGVEASVPLIVEGETVDADRARAIGLVDEVIAGELLPGALAFAAQVAARAEHPVASRREVAPPPGDDYFGALRAKLVGRKRGFPAPLEALACIEAARTMSFAEGLDFERSRFDLLVNGNESKALRHLFRAERAAARIEGLPPGLRPAPIAQVAVIGAGTMGGGIAIGFADAGIPVVLVESRAEALERGLERIRRHYEAGVEKKRLSAAQAGDRIGRIRGTLELDQAASADLTIEAVFEDMDVKRALFGRLDAVCKPGAILATNTSRLDVNAIAASTSRPHDVIGLHYFSPAHVMRLVEVVRGAQTDPRTVVTAMDLVRRIGKLPVLVGVCDGFVGNRMSAHYAREAEFLLEEGASPREVDDALQAFGFAMGRFTTADLAGLDISYASRKRLAASRPAHLRYSKVSDRICEAGRLGQKTGAGFYRYAPGSRAPLPDPEVDRIIEACAREAGIERRTIGAEEIVERTVYALVNEGAKVLADGIAQRASDIDLIFVNGYGFPAWRGGPMFYANTVGLPQVYERVCAFHRRHGELWTPAPLLRELALGGGSFS